MTPSDSLGPKLTRRLRSEKPWDDAMGREFESPHLHHKDLVNDQVLCFAQRLHWDRWYTPGTQQLPLDALRALRGGPPVEERVNCSEG